MGEVPLQIDTCKRGAAHSIAADISDPPKFPQRAAGTQFHFHNFPPAPSGMTCATPSVVGTVTEEVGGKGSVCLGSDRRIYSTKDPWPAVAHVIRARVSYSGWRGPFRQAPRP